MTKKIIAVSLVILLIAVSFVACGKDKGYLLSKDEKGFEHAYVTDAEGNTVLDDNGNIRVYETDKNGEIATNDDGSKKENKVENETTNGELVVNIPYTDTKIFKFNCPKGYSEANGQYVKDNTDGKITIGAYYVDDLTGNTTLNEYLNNLLEGQAGLMESFTKSFANYDSSIKDIKALSDNRDACVYEFIGKDKDGKVTYYVYSVYFLIENKIVNVHYCSLIDSHESHEQIMDMINSNYVVK